MAESLDEHTESSFQHMFGELRGLRTAIRETRFYYGSRFEVIKKALAMANRMLGEVAKENRDISRHLSSLENAQGSPETNKSYGWNQGVSGLGQ